ncbi:hypothetical protein CHISP_3644 [Chitinispirillum alkaliphilum]|nr:hypothetical protein CHISP_3644 [Chitinispirillum alkaliphilum]
MSEFHFSKPPINEVVCGIQFDSSHFDFRIQDQFYEAIKDAYPNIKENPPLPIIFDREATPPQPVNRVPLIRHFFISGDNSKLIQLQDGRLLFNWRKIEEKHVYPKFDAVFSEFMKIWEKLSLIFEGNNIKVTPNQVELTYIDHIVRADFGEQWALEKIFTFFSKTPVVDDLYFRFGIPAPDLSGHLTITSQSGQRITDHKDVIILDSTLRGINRNMDISNWFKKAHDCIYAFFMDSITEDAKKIWGYSK